MDYTINRLFLIYYSGALFILFGFIYLIHYHFKNDENINIKEHIGIVLIYIFLLVLAMYLWGIISNFIDITLLKIEIYKKMMEKSIG